MLMTKQLAGCPQAASGEGSQQAQANLHMWGWSCQFKVDGHPSAAPARPCHSISAGRLGLWRRPAGSGGVAQDTWPARAPQ